MRRVGQLQLLQQVNSNPDPSRQFARKSVIRKLRVEMRCNEVQPIKEDLLDTLRIRMHLKTTQKHLEDYRNRKAISRRNG